MSPSLRCPGPSLICFEVMLYGQAWRTPFGFNELETLNSRPTNGVRSQYVRRSVESGRLNNGPIDGQCICVLFCSGFLIFAINRRKPGASTKRTRTMRMLFNFFTISTPDKCSTVCPEQGELKAFPPVLLPRSVWIWLEMCHYRVRLFTHDDRSV